MNPKFAAEKTGPKLFTSSASEAAMAGAVMPMMTES